MSNRTDRFSKALVSVAVLLLATGMIFAQGTTSRVSGVVTDESGDPVAGAKLTFISPALQGERVVETDDDGRYTAALLPSGSYAVSVAAPGQRPAQYSFRLSVGTTFPLDIALTPGSEMVEEVVVRGNLSKLQTTTQGETFDYGDQVETLPLTSRGLENVAQLAPNVSFGPTVSQNRNNFDLAIAGAPSMDTIVLLDGAEISDPLFGGGTTVYFEDSLKDLQVMTSGVSAKYGRFTGGVLNAVTKGGSNEYNASFRASYSREDWNSLTPFSGESQSSTLNETYWATVGGRIIRDHLWFFAGGRRIPVTNNTQSTTVTGGNFTTVASEERYQIRLTGAVNPNHTIDYSYLEFDGSSSGRAALPAAEDLAIGNRADPRDMTTISYQGILTPNLFVDVRATEKNAAIQSGGDPNGGSPFIDWNTFDIYNNHWWDFADRTGRDNETISANLTQVFSGLGSHTLEYGIQSVDSTTSGENRQSTTGFNFISRDLNFCYDGGNMQPCNVTTGGGGTVASSDVLFNIDSTQNNQRLRALSLGGDQTIENLALYVQDSWQINENWRVDIGLRSDDYKGDGPLDALNLDYNTVSPRLAVTRNLSDDWQVQMAWGEYTGRINDNWVQAVTSIGDAPGITNQYTGPDFLMVDRTVVEQVLRDTHPTCALEPNGSCWNTTVDFGDADQPTNFLADGLESPSATDLNFSLKRALPRNTGSVVFTYTHRQFDGLVDDFIGTFDTGLANVTV
ncbi:MAG: TonB-dependent receptor, partial [Acidobacteriota bacterium]|nr:TonB-dependent receptor [Acidobacteriota bacterium]